MGVQAYVLPCDFRIENSKIRQNFEVSYFFYSLDVAEILESGNFFKVKIIPADAQHHVTE